MRDIQKLSAWYGRAGFVSKADANGKMYKKVWICLFLGDRKGILEPKRGDLSGHGD